MGTVEFLKRLPHPNVEVTVVQRTQPLLSPLTGSRAPAADWLGDASSMVKPIQTFSWDLRVERHGQTLIPARGRPTYYPLLDDYLRVAATLFPDLHTQADLDSPTDIEATVESLRRRLGVDQPEPDDFKLFYLTAGGRMQNIKDDSPNISFQVKTFQSILDTLWDLAKSGLPGGFGAALAAAGRTAGVQFGGKLAELVGDQDRATTERAAEYEKELVKLWCAFDSQVGWGRLEADFPEDDTQSGQGVLRVWHNAFAEGRDLGNENDLCGFMGGYIGGVLTCLLGPEVSVVHGEAEPCIRRGADHCAFRFGPER
jgi:predicted hydrocarbon binding protein